MPRFRQPRGWVQAGRPNYVGLVISCIDADLLNETFFNLPSTYRILHNHLFLIRTIPLFSPSINLTVQFVFACFCIFEFSGNQNTDCRCLQIMSGTRTNFMDIRFGRVYLPKLSKFDENGFDTGISYGEEHQAVESFD